MPANRSVLVSLAVLAAVLMSVRGCNSYGEVNILTFEHAKALYAACNSKQPERLEACAVMIAEAQSSEQISGREAGYLQDIVETGQAGEWEDAQAMARQLMSDQAEF